MQASPIQLTTSGMEVNVDDRYHQALEASVEYFSLSILFFEIEVRQFVDHADFYYFD